MVNYTDNDPKGWCGDPKRGAALGRHPILEVDNNAEVEITIREVEIDEGGYDANGTYFGVGNPLWWVSTEDGQLDTMERAVNQVEAERKVREQYPSATIKLGDMIRWKRSVCTDCGHECEYYGCEHCGESPMDSVATLCCHCEHGE